MKTTSNCKSTLLAVTFFSIMALFSAVVCAQNDTVNPLLSTTGPNVLGQGKIQWNNSLEYHYLGMSLNNYPKINLNSFGVSTGLRFGVGNRAELTLDVSGAYNTFDTTYYHNNTGFTPSVGAKLLLYDGKGWLPRIAFFTHVALPIQQLAFIDNRWSTKVQPEIGLQFRNTIGERWFLDYSLGYSWNSISNGLADLEDLLQYSIGIHHLVTEKQSFGFTFTNDNSTHRMAGYLEGRWQASDNMQLLAKFGSALGTDWKGLAAGEINALVGLNWMIK